MNCWKAYTEKDGNQEKRFDNAFDKINGMKNEFKKHCNINKIFTEDNLISNVFNKIKDILSKKEEPEFNKFIEQTKDYFDLREEYKEDLIIIFKSKKYEMDVKSIKFFLIILLIKHYHYLRI